MIPLLAPVLLALASALGYASAALVQERLAATTAPSRFGLLRRPRWWAAAGLQSTGALLHVAALALGPLVVVQPLGVLTLVFAAPLAAVVVKRPVGAAGWRGILLVTLGLVGVLLLTGAGRGGPGSGDELRWAAGAVAALLVLLTVPAKALGRRTGGGGHGARRRAVTRSVLLAAASGTAHGAASFFVKTAVEEPSLRSLLAAAPLVALVAVLAVSGLALSQAAYRGGGLSAPLATTTVANPVLAATAGVLLLGEGFRFGTAGAAGAVCAGAGAAWGIAVLARESARERGGPCHGVRVVIPRQRGEEPPAFRRPPRFGTHDELRVLLPAPEKDAGRTG